MKQAIWVVSTRGDKIEEVEQFIPQIITRHLNSTLPSEEYHNIYIDILASMLESIDNNESEFSLLKRAVSMVKGVVTNTLNFERVAFTDHDIEKYRIHKNF